MKDEDVEVVDQLCRRRPLAIRVLRGHGIDPSSRETLATSCARAAAEVAEVVAALDAAERAAADPWRSRAITELLDHVLRTYHRPFAAELDVVVAALDHARPSDGPELATWVELRQQLAELETALVDHMEKEEQVLFPWLRGRAETAAAPIRAMQLDHGDTIQLLLGVHAATARWLSIDGTPAASAAVAELDKLERWLCEHIHLENNVLFRRALDSC